MPQNLSMTPTRIFHDMSRKNHDVGHGFSMPQNFFHDPDTVFPWHDHGKTMTNGKIGAKKSVFCQGHPQNCIQKVQKWPNLHFLAFFHLFFNSVGKQILLRRFAEIGRHPSVQGTLAQNGLIPDILGFMGLTVTKHFLIIKYMLRMISTLGPML